MKKILLAFFVLLLSCVGTSVFAAGGYINQGGFSGNSNATFTSATNVKNLKNDTYVTLKGTIVSKIGNEKYLFKDNSGTIEVDIDDENWGGIKVGPVDTVIIQGEVDKDWNYVSIDVDTIQLCK